MTRNFNSASASAFLAPVMLAALLLWSPLLPAVLACDIVVSDFTKLQGVTVNNMGYAIINSYQGVSFDASTSTLLVDCATLSNADCQPYTLSLISQAGRCFDLSHYDVQFTVTTTATANFSVELQTNYACCSDWRKVTRYRYPLTVLGGSTYNIDIPLGRFSWARLSQGYSIAFVGFSGGAQYRFGNVTLMDRAHAVCNQQ
ncbi:hypothetical protein RI367_005892 [Sorochytrium milnesiophthora]